MRNRGRFALVLVVVTTTFLAPTAQAQRRTSFVPSQHGFHFGNNFENYIGPITTYGRCGGMAMAALDYYYWGIPVPTHQAGDFGTARGVPPNGSRLSNYIWDRLLNTILTTNDGGFLHFITGPPWLPGSTWDDHYRWSVNDEFPRIRERIDANRPFVLGLRPRESDLAKAHQVVAIGYAENPKRVYVYDNNFPDEEVVLQADEANRRILHIRTNGQSSPVRDAYASYFVHNVHFTDVRPPYLDLGLQRGILLYPGSPTGPRVGEKLSIEVVVRNFGDYPARVNQMYIYVRDPLGRNRDNFLGGGDNDPSLIPPGGERRIVRSTDRFGDMPGAWRIGVSYLSQQDHWIGVPPVAPGTQQEVTLNLR